MRVFFLVALSLVSLTAKADERYFVQMYSYQSPGLNRARMSHTFAVFVKVKDGYIDDSATISWLPQPSYMQGLFRDKVPAFRAVPGQNYSLKATLDLAAKNGYTTVTFGAYEITPDTFERAQKQEKDLNKGAYQYKMIDNHGDALNCINAVAEVVAPVNTGLRRGAPATQAVMEHFREHRAIVGAMPDRGVGELIRGFINRRPLQAHTEPVKPVRRLLANRRSH